MTARQRHTGDELPGPAEGQAGPGNTDVPSGERGVPASVPAGTRSAPDSVPAAEGEAAAGTEASWDAYDQALAAAVRERDRALDKATARLASVTAGGYLEYDRSVSLAWAAFEADRHNAALAHAAAVTR